MELVGQSEWHELLEQQAVTNQICRITNQVRSTYSQAFLRVAIISMLMSGADGHLSVAESSVQTDSAVAGTGWMYVSFVLCIALLTTMWMHLSLEPATPQAEVTGDACGMLMMYLGYLQLTVVRFRRKLNNALERLNAFEPMLNPVRKKPRMSNHRPRQPIMPQQCIPMCMIP